MPCIIDDNNEVEEGDDDNYDNRNDDNYSDNVDDDDDYEDKLIDDVDRWSWSVTVVSFVVLSFHASPVDTCDEQHDGVAIIVILFNLQNIRLLWRQGRR